MQWPDFNLISQKCSSNAPLPKLLNWFHSETKWRSELKIEKLLNDISSQAYDRISK